MNNITKRIAYRFKLDTDSSVTILRPLSNEYTHNGNFIVIYESAYSVVDIHILTIEKIVEKFGIDIKDLKDTL